MKTLIILLIPFITACASIVTGMAVGSMGYGSGGPTEKIYVDNLPVIAETDSIPIITGFIPQGCDTIAEIASTRFASNPIEEHYESLRSHVSRLGGNALALDTIPIKTVRVEAFDNHTYEATVLLCPNS